MFRKDKVTQMAAQFLKLANGKMECQTLLKLLYIADKKALLTWGEPIVYDNWVSMQCGPVLSMTYDLIKAGDKPHEEDYWAEHICKRGDVVELASDPGDDDLSRAENEIIDAVFSEFGHIDKWDLAKLSHAFPEWTKTDSALPIRYEDVLKNSGFQNEDILNILDNIKSQDTDRVLLGA